ncbi:proto-oncogene Mas-like [Ambystoma mexicanum]|uniref:proto-oncogene Mas-like n=1 Tax=Ambystoma mexicanum TaxID=8296 RepID=UPI0037E728FF
MTGLGNMSLNITDAAGFNETADSMTEPSSSNSFITAAAFILLISILGLIGNSLVFWYLGFKIKRTKYTVYIINLAVADLIYLFCISIVMCITIVLFLKDRPISNAFSILKVLEITLNCGYYAEMFFLTAVSLERCISIYHPIWYPYKWLKFQSAVVCFIIWVLSCLVTLVDNLGCPPELFGTVAYRCTAVHTFLSVLVFLVIIPIMVISSLTLVIKIRKTSTQVQRSKFVIVIVASVIIFLLSVAPMRLLWLLLYLQVYPHSFSVEAFFFAVYICVSINSSVNPFIYFLVGRLNMKGVQVYLEGALKKVFREDEEEEGDREKKDHEEGDTIDSTIS